MERTVIEGEVVGAESREGCAGEVPAALGRDRSDSGARSSPTPSAARGHALRLPGEPLKGAAERVAKLLAEGMTPAEAQEQTGLSARKMVAILDSAETCRRVLELVGQRVQLSSGEAVEAVVRLMRSGKTHRIQLDAAKELLERSGVGTGDKASNSPVTVIIEL